MATEDHESLEETNYLLRAPVNAARLLSAADDVRTGRTLLARTMEELEAAAAKDGSA